MADIPNGIDPDRPLALIVRVTAQPGKRSEVEAHFRGLVDEADRDPHTRHFIVHQDRNAPDALCMYELYDNWHALDAHRSTAAYQSARDALQSLLAGPPDLLYLHATSGTSLPAG